MVLVKVQFATNYSSKTNHFSHFSGDVRKADVLKENFQKKIFSSKAMRAVQSTTIHIL